MPTGRCRQLWHFGPICALTVIAICSLVTQRVYWSSRSLTSTNANISDDEVDWASDVKIALEYLVYVSWTLATLYNFFRAAFEGPGFVPLSWQPREREHGKFLQFCEVCKGFKPPRVHHCRRCKRCVPKMDHHCPWINACVGQRNQASFIYFLLFANIGCTHSLFYLLPFVYRLVYFIWYYQHDRKVYLQLISFPWWFVLFIFLAIGLSFGIIISLSVLFYIQFRQSLRNKTSIEEHIVKKATAIREFADDEHLFPGFKFPYDLGWKRNLSEVFLKSTFSHCDFLSWPVRSECSIFDMTLEQLRQKQVKRDRALLYDIEKPFNGSRCACFQYGCRILFPQPFFGEILLKLQTGDKVSVTRNGKRWLYGEITNNSQSEKTQREDRKRGWFPRGCAQLSTDGMPNDDNDKKVR